MKLTILGTECIFENNEKGTYELVEKINEFLDEHDLFFSHLVIDGQEVYTEHVEYLLNNIQDIKLVTLVVRTINEFVSDLLVSLNDYTKRGIPEIEKVIDEFYQSPTEQSWESLNLLLEGIGWIYQTVNNIDSTKHNIVGWKEFLKSMATFDMELPNLLEAMENKDSILIADIIQYEILPQFQIINAETEKNFEVK